MAPQDDCRKTTKRSLDTRCLIIVLTIHGILYQNTLIAIQFDIDIDYYNTTNITQLNVIPASENQSVVFDITWNGRVSQNNYNYKKKIAAQNAHAPAHQHIPQNEGPC